ncbi:putative quinol monooxygenase [Pseudomonas fluorescens]|uniref:ABM domain-containing protein n=1 Tax=Pseudomonas fluorescens TaxID=294 RepID=A0A5E7CQJ9_PSEFL|nr:hypothetical protein [Pseudomonas fluorescens]VVN97653.1 hypothetical protein PS710_02398 [Pseudomonas fluorescens]
MSRIETHVHYRIQSGKLTEFKAVVDGLAATAQPAGACLLRCDWFVNEAHGEAIAMTVYRDEAALCSHLEQACHSYGCMAELCGQIEYEVFGKLGEAARRLLPVDNAVTLHFATGLSDARSLAECDCPAVGAIEIYTRFDIHPGKLELFKQLGAQLFQIVDDKDSGTLRYDWFYDEANLRCVVMDTYADTQGMFAHMRNAHDAHEKLLEHASMTTQFLGELPGDAFVAVEKYEPFIASLHARLTSS